MEALQDFGRKLLVISFKEIFYHYMSQLLILWRQQKDIGQGNVTKDLENLRSEHNTSNNYNSTSNRKSKRLKDKLVGPPRFGLESLAPKAKRIDQATLRAQHFFE